MNDQSSFRFCFNYFIIFLYPVTFQGVNFLFRLQADMNEGASMNCFSVQFFLHFLNNLSQ